MLVNNLIATLPARWQLTARQFLKFAVTGLIGTVVDFGTYTFFTRLLGWGTIPANSLSVFLAILCNFLINRAWTFRAGQGKIGRQGISYFLLNGFTWAANQAIVTLFAFHIPLFTHLFGPNRDLVAKVAAIGIILWVNFLGSKFLIFRMSKVS